MVMREVFESVGTHAFLAGEVESTLVGERASARWIYLRHEGPATIRHHGFNPTPARST